jgi:hypothetical protein
MSFKLRTAIGVGAVGLTAVIGTTPALALDGHVYNKEITPGHTDAGASAAADLKFGSTTHVTYTNFTVNDICPGDGYRVFGRAAAVLSDGSTIYGAKHYDEGGCDSAAWKSTDPLYLDTSKRIVKAGIQACVDLGSTNACATPTYRDNPH